MSRWYVVLAFVCATASAQPSTFSADAFLSLRGMNASGPKSWLEGGDGRLDSHRDRAGFAVGQAELAWEPSESFGARVHLIGRAEPAGTGGSRAGVVEAFVEGRRGEWQLRAGQFFLPTSRENTQAMWSSPYTLTLSALNSWIAHEFRPIGVEAQWKRNAITVAGTAFGGNDTSGTLLGWRGWAMSHRLSGTGETLPVVVPSGFHGQQPGTTAFGRDLDGRLGYAARVRLSSPDRALLQYAYADNGGDRELHGDEYSWATRFHVISAELGSLDRTKLIAEASFGETGMGFAPGAWVQADFYTGYLLLSQKGGRSRYSARFDVFATLERDHSIGGNTAEHGRSWTLAWLFDVTPRFRAGVEFVQVTGERDAAFDGRSVMVEVRAKLR